MWGALIAAGGTLAGQFLSMASEQERRELEDEALRLYGNISLPNLEKVIASRVEGSAAEGIPQDFGNREARNRALQAIVNEGLSGGNSLESRLALEESRRATSAQELQGRQAVMQQAQMRGLSGGGPALAAQLQAQQAGADRHSMAGLSAAASARQRALQSLAQGGGMAAQAEGQDFDRAARVAESRDRIAQFNASQAQQANLYNAGLAQQQFSNRMNLTGARYNAMLGRAQQHGRDAQTTQNFWAGAGGGAGAGLDNFLDDKKKKP